MGGGRRQHVDVQGAEPGEGGAAARVGVERSAWVLSRPTPGRHAFLAHHCVDASSTPALWTMLAMDEGVEVLEDCAGRAR